MINFKEKFKRSKTTPPALPKVSLPFDQELKSTQKKYGLMFVILLIISLFYSYFYAEKRVYDQELIKVIVWGDALNEAQIITTANLATQTFSREQLPLQYFTKNDEVIGRTVIRSVEKNEIVSGSDFQNDLDPTSVSADFKDFFAFTMDEDWFVANLPDIKKYDLINILATNPKYGVNEATVIAENMSVISVQKNKLGRKTLVVNITKSEAESLLFARGLKLPMHVLVHSGIKKSPENNQ